MARTQLELAENAFDVRFGGLLADDELLRDLPIGLAARQELGNFPFARRKRMKRCWMFNLCAGRANGSRANRSASATASARPSA